MLKIQTTDKQKVSFLYKKHSFHALALDINRLRPFADAGVIRAAQRNPHQGKDRINKTLCGPQSEPEYAFNHQDGGDGKVRMALRSAP